MSHIFGGGEAKAGNILSPPEFDEAGEIVQRITASEEDLRKIGEAASNVEGLKEVGQEILEIANHPVDVTGGVGGEVSWKAQKVIEHALQVMEGPDTAGGGDVAVQNTRIFGPLIDAARVAAEGATEAGKVIQATVSDPAAAEKAAQAADIAAKAGI